MSELLKINVNEHTERKNGLTYLSWAWAWAEVLKLDPQATWVAHTYGPQGAEEPCMRVGKTAMVHVSVTIKGLRRECMLPVMDHRNKAIPDPDAFAVNTAIMRCLAKAIAMHGLGLYIYAGEDLPEEDSKPKPVQAGVITATDGAGEGLSDERLQAIREMVAEWIDAHHHEQDMPVISAWYAPETFQDNDERVFAWALLKTESKLRALIKANSPSNQKAAA